MKRMSFAATVAPMYAQTKTVTRRRPETWKRLEPGDLLMAIEKGLGLKAGEKQKCIHPIEIVSVRVEPLARIHDYGEAAREGFKSVHEFLAVWVEMNGTAVEGVMVRRIEFKHRPDLGE